MRLIETSAALDQVVERLGGESLLAIDTEAASFHRYHDRIYLLQISSRGETVLIDPLRVETLQPIGDLLADPAVEVVFHDADYDLRLFDRHYGFRATNLFDTRIAAQLLNEPGVGLAALLEKYLRVRLDKKFQRADWSARPLSPPMLDYAASDTRHLPELRDILRDQLKARGRLSWAEEEFQLLTATRYAPPNGSEPAYLRIKGAKQLRGRELAVLRELFDWREALAREADRASFRILNNEPMLVMARNPPTDLASLRTIAGVSADQVARRGRDILAAVRRGLELPEADLPRIERGPRQRPDPALDARLDRLKGVRTRLAAQFELPPGVLCPNGTLEAIARANPATLDALAGIEGVRQWQVRELGAELLAALPGPGADLTA